MYCEMIVLYFYDFDLSFCCDLDYDLGCDVLNYGFYFFCVFFYGNYYCDVLIVCSDYGFGYDFDCGFGNVLCIDYCFYWICDFSCIDYVSVKFKFFNFVNNCFYLEECIVILVVIGKRDVILNSL